MKAVRVAAPNEIESVEIPPPTPDDRMMTVSVETVGICGTDVKILHGKIPVDYPRVLGHEVIGTVVANPAGVGPQPGSRVLIDPAITCGRCRLCRDGRTNLCLEGGLLGRDRDGVFTEMVTADPARVLEVPDSISGTAAGLLQVLGTCVHAQRQVDVFPGQTAAVIGLGVSGQLMVQLLRQRGVAVVGITRSQWKRDLALQSGAVAAAAPDDAAAVLAEVTGGQGPELVVEAVGQESSLAASIELVAPGGEVLVFGTLTGAGSGLPYYQMYLKELTIHNPRAALLDDYAVGIRLAATGRLDLEPIVTHQLGLADARQAFDLVDDPSSLKVLMHVG